ncbi:MAG: tRNA lysidine(34) synthetase TilS [Myxococcales bacterium]|nr:tRNA lysidine(34) synthetase TilS [Myxococcales bacterium]MCB9642452.1 tRNA lysidine(34) synthetase TilS [Myxococcales bacterium]
MIASSLWDALLQRVHSFSQKEKLFAPNERVLVGVSGGIDSVCLWRVLCALAEPLQIQSLVAVYLDHGLRIGQTEQEAAWVCELAERSGYPSEVLKLHIAKEGASLQARAREERRRALVALAEKHDCTRIALGHHEDDQAETLLLRFLRGTGPRGLAGIWPQRDHWVRPLLCVSRREITAVFQEQGWTWCEDPTNQETYYQRNLLRHQLLPSLKEAYSPHLGEHLSHLAWRSRQDEDYFSSQLDALWKEPWVLHEDGVLCLGLEAWRALPMALAWRCLQRALWEVYGETLSEHQLMHLVEVAQSKGGSAQASLPQSMNVFRVRDVLWFLPQGYLEVGEPESLALPVEEGPWCLETMWGRLKGRVIFSHEEGNDLEHTMRVEGWRVRLPLPTLADPLFLRARSVGDVVFSRGGRRSLKRWLIDQGVPAFFRDLWPVLGGTSSVVWLPGITSLPQTISPAYLELVLTPSPWLSALQRLFFAVEKRHLVSLCWPFVDSGP